MPEVAAVRTVTSPEDLREFLIGGHIAAAGAVSYTHLTLPTTPYV